MLNRPRKSFPPYVFSSRPPTPCIRSDVGASRRSMTTLFALLGYNLWLFSPSSCIFPSIFASSPASPLARPLFSPAHLFARYHPPWHILFRSDLVLSSLICHKSEILSTITSWGWGFSVGGRSHRQFSFINRVLCKPPRASTYEPCVMSLIARPGTEPSTLWTESCYDSSLEGRGI
jgi:hypothetical protein